jgi:uncharacterized coiled-coil protein SlyX
VQTEELNNLRNEKMKLNARVIDLEGTVEKIGKQNLLIDELNSEFYGLNVHELGKKINRRMFEALQRIQTEHIKKMQEFSKLVKG